MPSISANIGSAASIFGNPQNAFIVASLNLEFYEALTTLLPAALIGLALNTMMLYVLCKLIRVDTRHSCNVLEETAHQGDCWINGRPMSRIS